MSVLSYLSKTRLVILWHSACFSFGSLLCLLQTEYILERKLGCSAYTMHTYYDRVRFFLLLSSPFTFTINPAWNVEEKGKQVEKFFITLQTCVGCFACMLDELVIWRNGMKVEFLVGFSCSLSTEWFRNRLCLCVTLRV